ncbi:MAG: 50S ribosomal protein L4 [Clostridia bacterium]|nr:50S ribosomal protein L4 [Clostridia bacterium]MDY5263741.1 50S ribosomal protein L4 [Eubacteriales bacterium]MDY5439173.1 50S ribosomal protein L4 [Eubacteriales bacterium]
MEINVVNATGKVCGKMNVNDSLFAAEYNEALIHQVVVAQLANKRQGTKCTLTRTEVRGGGIKPYRQKGTGRARQGSIRAPQFVKGGVVFAPKPRDFSKKINKKMKDAALASALSKKLVDNEFTVVNEIALKENKTKEIATLLKNLKLDKTTYLVYDDSDSLIARVAKNIPTVVACHVDLVNVYDLVANKNCLFTQKAVEKLEEVYA